MKNIFLVISVLDKIIECLASSGECDWQDRFNKIRANYNPNDEESFEDIRYSLRRLYGGMGSFNDLVLHEESKPMIKNNNELDQLRKELFNLLHER